MPKSKYTVSPLPKEFVLGVATAAYQIEGAAKEDGRMPSIWDDFCHAGGNVVNNDSGDVACNHYHLWESDLDLIKSLNVDAYRFSFAWPRIIPNGVGSVNEKGLAFYDKLIDGCLARGIKPFGTLYHWDLPSALQGNGGWANRDTALAFADYAELIASRFGDRLANISTFNEPWCSSILSNLYGIHAPGNKDMATTVKCIHHQHLAHGLAVERIKSKAQALPVGIVLNLQSIYTATDTAEDKAAAERHRAFHNDSFLGPLFEGAYPEIFLNALGDDLPLNWEAELKTINQPLDFWGLNYYTPARVAHDEDKQALFPQSKNNDIGSDTPITDIGWEIAADTFEDVIIDTYKRFNLPPLYITENGACFNDEPANGVIDDERRVQYLDQHIGAMLSARAAGIPIHGYFAWSLMDNFEWAEGYAMRFGIVHVDYNTQKRTIKKSGHWLSQLSSNRA